VAGILPPRSRGARAGRPLGVLVALMVASLAACASTWKATGRGDRARVEHRDLGFSLLLPQAIPAGVGAGAPGSAWNDVDVDGAALAYRHATEGATMTLLVECDRGVAEPRVRARQLLFGVDERGRVDGFEVDLQGLEGWVQRVHVSEKDHSVALKTVTVVDRTCTLDWVLVQRPDVPPERSLERVFDRWWRSFERRRGMRPVSAEAET